MSWPNPANETPQKGCRELGSVRYYQSITRELKMPNANAKPKPKEIPAWARKALKSDEEIIFDGRLRRYRADLLGGCFRCADREDSAIGSTLKIQIFDCRWDTQSRYGTTQPYFDIAFVDNQNVASCLSLCRDSAINMAEWIRNLAVGESPIFPEALSVFLDMRKVATESGAPYHEVFVKDWEFVSELQFNTVTKFKSSDRYLNHQWQGIY